MSDFYPQSFDTYKYIKELKGSGFNELQAEVIVKSLQESREYNFSKLATREQISLMELTLNNKIDGLESKILQVEEKLESKISQVEERLESKISQIEQNLKTEIAASQFNMLKWIIPFFITIIGMITGLLIKLL
ncbi:DUF1640 domain-containing protein [Holosporaceae bacterium 'Namur']|nr:DUF1640 domain-containing protein [Holosporaceae bacterium 'Namur']